MRRAATSLGLTFERRFALPEGIDELPCMRLIPIGNRFIASGFAGERDGRLIAVFSRSYTFDEYEATVWRSCAAARVDIEAPFLRVARQQGVTRLNFPRAYTVGMHRQNLEWEAFDRRWHVETRDRRFAVTLLDQRMMDWLMTCGNYAFETGGRWVMVETAGDDVEALQDLIDVLDGFVERVPPAALSIYAPA
jgi:hypothetical protein